MPNRPVVLFDLDGTLVDTERIAMEVTEKYFRSQGHSPHPEHLRILVGRAWEPALAGMLEQYPISRPLAMVVEEVLTQYRAALQQGVLEVPGSLALVRALASDFRLAVVSGSHREDIETLLSASGVREHFEAIFAYGDYPESKPSASPYEVALSRLNIERENVLVFEDSSAGIRSAQAAGLEVVAVGEPPLHDSERPQTNWEVHDFLAVDKTWVLQRARPKK